MDWKADRQEGAVEVASDLRISASRCDPFAAAIRSTRMSMLITDPRQPDNPIIFANDAFGRLTGYSRDEILGRNCRFLQGPDTDPATIDYIRDCIRQGTDLNVDVLNYRKDGSRFWNALYISPVFSDDGELQFFFASQLDVTDRKAAEFRVSEEKDRFEQAVAERTRDLRSALEAQQTLLHEVDHRVKNNLQMVSSLILMQSRNIGDEGIKQTLRSMLERVEALSTVHRRLYQSKDVSRFDVADFVRDLVTDLLAASGRTDIEADFDLEPMVIPAEKATPVALIINELVTNALKHAYSRGFQMARQGTLGVRLVRDDRNYVVEVWDDGPGMPSTPNDTSFGMRLIRSLTRQLQAEIE
ncbi:MAG: PAS domain-containing protein, partial [Rhizobiaceae bacterium]|nr:PAS domain-containing protein [Rhizobiaceae bacterium]